MVKKIEKTQAWERREEILRIVESIGSVHVSKTELAKKYGVSVVQIKKDFDALADKISKVDKKALTLNVNLVFEFAQNELLKIARNDKQKPMDKVKAINSLVNTMDKKIDSLLKLGLIKPAEETLNITHSANTELYEKVIKVARELRKRKGVKRDSAANA